jgi:hypothetical protein
MMGEEAMRQSDYRTLQAERQFHAPREVFLQILLSVLAHQANANDKRLTDLRFGDIFIAVGYQ